MRQGKTSRRSFVKVLTGSAVGASSLTALPALPDEVVQKK